MYIKSRNHILLLENLKQAKQYLKKQKNYEDEFYQDSFNHIVDKLKKFPNLIDTFTRIIFPKINVEEVGEDYRVHPHLINTRLQEFDRIVSWIIENKNIVNQLPKNITQYKDLEELSDDIVQLEMQRKVKKFIKSLYRSMRDSVKNLNESDKKRFNDLALQFMELPEEAKNQFTPLKYFEKNNISIQEFMEVLSKFLSGQDVNEHEKKIREYVKKNDLDITYDKNGVIVIQTNNKEHICNLGSQKWCLVYSPDTYHKMYVGDTKNTQYIIYNFNLPSSNKNSMFGITLKPSGEIVSHGTSQNKLNQYIAIDTIKEMTDIPDSALYSEYQEEYDRIKSNIDSLNIGNIGEDNNINDLKKWVDNYQSIGFKDLDLKSFGISYDYRGILKLMYNSFDNYVDLFNFFKGKELVLKTLAENQSHIALFNNGKYKKLSFKKVINGIDNDTLKLILHSSISFLELFLEIGIIKEDILFLLHRIQYSHDTNDLITFKFITNAVNKYGWEKISDFVILNSIEWFENIASLHSKKSISYYLDGQESIKTNISIDLYKKLINELNIYEKNEFDYFITLYVSDEDKLELIKSGYTSVFKFLNTEDWSRYISYLKSLPILKRIEVINKNSKFGEYFIKTFEKQLYDIDDSLITEIMDEMIKEDGKLDIVQTLIKYPYVFYVFSASLNSNNIAKKMGKGSLYKLLYFDGIKRSITNLSSGDIHKYMDIRFDSDEVLDVYNKIGSLIEKISYDIKNANLDDDNELIRDPFKVADDVYFKNTLKKFYEELLSRYVREYLTTLDVETSPIKRDYNYRVIQPAMYEDKFKTFHEYWQEYNKIIHVYNPNEDEKYELFFENIDDQIRHWSDRKEESYSGRKGLLFEEVEEVGLKEVILKYGDDYGRSRLDLIDDYYVDVEKMTTDYLQFVGSMLLDYDGDNSIAHFAKYLAGGSKDEYYKEIGLKYHEEKKKWYTIINWDDLAELYDISNFRVNPLDTENLWEIFDSGWNDYYLDINETVDYMNIDQLYRISRYLYESGFDFIDLSIFNKLSSYIKKRKNIDRYYFDCDHKKTTELRREHKELRDLYSDIEDILDEKIDSEKDYEEAYDNIDLDEIKSSFNHAWSQVDNDARANEWWDSSISNASELLNSWEEEKGLHDLLKWSKDYKLMVIPDVDLLESDEDLIITLSEYTDLSGYIAWDILRAYVDKEGKLSLADDNGYHTWSDANYDYFNDDLGERFYEADIDVYDLSGLLNTTNENISIVKFENFEIDRQFLGEFSSEEDAKEDLEYYKNQINDLQKNGGTVYRLVFLEDISNLDTNNLGEHWTLELSQLSNFYNSLNSDMNKDMMPYLITATLKPGQIDEDSSYGAYKQLPHELEINLKSDPELYKVSVYKDHPDAMRRWNNLLG